MADPFDFMRDYPQFVDRSLDTGFDPLPTESITGVVWHERGGQYPLGGDYKKDYPYHIEVQPDGRAIMHRRGTQRGAHAWKYNDYSLGVAYSAPVGSEPTPEARKTFQFIYDGLRKQNPKWMHETHGDAYKRTQGTSIQASEKGRGPEEARWLDQLKANDALQDKEAEEFVASLRQPQESPDGSVVIPKPVLVGEGTLEPPPEETPAPATSPDPGMAIEEPVAAEPLDLRFKQDETDVRMPNIAQTYTTPEQAYATLEKMHGAGDIGAADVMWALPQTNMFINNVEYGFEQAYRLYDPNYWAKDPNFRVTDEDLTPYQEHEWGYLMAAPNKAILDQRKAELDRRKEAAGVWSKTSWGTYLAGSSLSLAIEVAPYIATGGWTMGAASWATGALGLKGGSQLYSALALEGAAVGFGDAIAGYKSGQLSETGALGVTVGGAMAGPVVGGLFSRIFKDKHTPMQTRKINEAIEDHADRVRKESGDTSVRPKVDTVTEIDETGVPPRTKVDVDNSAVVVREHTPEQASVAARSYEDDVGVVNNYFVGKTLPNARKVNITQAVAEAFERQHTILQAPETVYVAVKRGLENPQDAFQRGLLMGSKNLEDVATPNQLKNRTVDIYSMQLPAGTRVMPASNYGSSFADTVQSKMLIADGGIKLKAPRDETIGGFKRQVIDADYAPFNPGKGTVQFAAARAKAGGETLPLEALDELNADLITNGAEASALKRGASVGAARVNPDDLDELAGGQYSLQSIPRDTKDLIADIEKTAPAREGLMGIPWSIARISLLLNSKNAAVRTLAPSMMGGAMRLSRKQIKEGKVVTNLKGEKVREGDIVRPMATDEVKNEIVRRHDKGLMETANKHFTMLVKELKDDENFRKLSNMEKEDWFNETTFRYQTDISNGGTEWSDAQPEAIKAYGRALDKIYADFLDMLKDPGKVVGRPGEFDPVGNADQIPTRSGWMPRSWSYRKTQHMQEKFGDDVLARFLKAQFEETLKDADLQPSVVKQIAYNMNDNIIKAKGGWNAWVDAAFGKQTPQEIVAMLRKITGGSLDEETAQKIMSYLSRESKDTGKPNAGTNLKYRAMIREDLEVEILDVNNKVHKVRVHDFIEDNATELTRHYINRNAGRIALGSWEIPGFGPEGKSMMGIKNDDDWQKIMETLGFTKIETGATSRREDYFSDVLSDQAIFENWYQHMTGTYPHSTKDWLRFAKMTTTFSFLGKSGFPQASELVNSIGETGFAGLARLGSFRQLMANIKDEFRMARKKGEMPEFVSELSRYVYDQSGFGSDMLRNTGLSRFDHAAGMDPSRPRNDTWRKVLRTGEKAQNFVLNTSGLTPSTSWLQMRTIEAQYDKILGFALKHKSWSNLPTRHRGVFLNMGLDQNDVDRLFSIFSDEKVVQRSDWLGGMHKMVDGIDESKLDDSAKALLFRARVGINRIATEAIQENKWGMMFPGADRPAVQMFLQLRSFMIASVHSQFINNSRRMAGALMDAGSLAAKGNFSMKDGAGDAMMELLQVGTRTFGQMASGMLFYVLMMEATSLGKSDEELEAMREKIYDMDNLALAGISRSGWLGFVPFVYDTIAPMLGSHTAFSGYRSSGLAENVFGMPMLAIPGNLAKGAGGAYNLAFGDDPTTKDAAAIQRAITNLWFIEIATNVVASQLAGLDPPEEKAAPPNIIERLVGLDD